MRHLAAYLMLMIGGNEKPTAEDIKSVLESVGAEAEDEKIEKLLADLEGKNTTVLINDARVMSKGQVTIPKNIREALGVTTGDRVTFIFENGSVRVINSAVYAMQKFQEQMKGQAEKAGFASEEDVADWITNTRREENAE